MVKCQVMAKDHQDLQVHLRILATTDLHVHIMPYDYFSDKPAPAIGLAGAAGLIRKVRAEVPNCLLFDIGDFLQGNPLSDWAAANDATCPNPMIAAMNTLDYDGATLGNHEFNYGLSHLQKALSQAQFPVVSANITTNLGKTAQADKTFVAPWKIIERRVLASDGTWHDLNIGIIGFAPPQITEWEYYTLGDKIGTRDIIEAAQSHVPSLRAAGADVVIALSHSGIGQEVHEPGMENAAVALAAVPGIDAILTGHTHKVFPGPDTASTPVIDAKAGTLHGVPTVMAGYHGSHLGVIDLQLRTTGTGWQQQSHLTRALPVADHRSTDQSPTIVEPDATVINSARDVHDQVLKTIRLPLAHTTTPVFSYFSKVAPCPMLTLFADALEAAGRTALQGLEEHHLPLITAVAPVKAGGWGRPDHYIDIPAGPIARRNAAELYPYPNKLCLLQLTGADIHDWLETAAAGFERVERGVTDQPLINCDVPSYNRDVLYGLTYQIDPSAAIGRRVSDIRLATNAPLDPKQPVVVVTNGYRGAGGGGYPAAKRGKLLKTQQPSIHQVIVNYLETHKTVSPTAKPVWRFAPLAKTAAWFQCGPNATPHLHRLRGADVSNTGIQTDGFFRFALRFPQG